MTFDRAAFIQTQTQIVSPPLLPEVKLHLATEVTPLWTLTEERLRQADLPPPFWAFAWPGGQGAARYILDHPEVVCGKKVIDFAAGSGLVGIAAAKVGAKHVLAVDIDPLALESVRLNAKLNNCSIDAIDGVDLASPCTKADIIFAGDVCYSQAMSTAVIRWLRLCIDAGILVILADPGRAYLPHDGMVNLASYDVPTSREIEDSDVRKVTVWRLENASGGALAESP